MLGSRDMLHFPLTKEANTRSFLTFLEREQGSILPFFTEEPSLLEGLPVGDILIEDVL